MLATANARINKDIVKRQHGRQAGRPAPYNLQNRFCKSSKYLSTSVPHNRPLKVQVSTTSMHMNKPDVCEHLGQRRARTHLDSCCWREGLHRHQKRAVVTEEFNVVAVQLQLERAENHLRYGTVR